MVKKILIGLLIGFVIVVIGGTIVVKVLFPPEKIKEMVIPHIEKALGREVKVEKASASIIPFIGVTLKEVSIHNSKDGAFLQEPFVKLKAFRVKVAFWPLFKKEVLIDEVLFDKLDILIEKSLDGRYNYEDLAFMIKDSTDGLEKKEKSGGLPKLPIPISLKTFQINNSSIRVYDHETGQTTTVKTINHDIALDMDKTLEKVSSKGALQLADVTIEQKGKPTPVKDFKVTFSHEISANLVVGTITLNSVKLSLQQLALEMTGGVSDIWGVPELDLHIKTAPIEIADIVAEIPVEAVPAVAGLEAKGTLGFDVVVTGSYKEPIYTGNIDIVKGYLKNKELPKALTDLSLKSRFNAEQFILEDLSFTMGNSPFWMKLLVQDFKAPIIDGHLQADLHMGEIGEVFNLPENTSLSGRLKADITAEGLLDPEQLRKLALDGELLFDNLAIKAPELKVPAVINGTTKLSSKEIIALLKVKLGTTIIDGSVRVTEFIQMVLPQKGDEPKRAKVVMKVAADKLVTSQILAEPELKEGDAETETPAKMTTEQALLAPILLPVDLWLEARIKHLIYDNIEIDRLKLSLQSIHETLTMAIDGKMYGGDVTTKIDFRRKDAKNLQLQALFNVHDVDANKAFSAYNDQLSDASKLNRYLKDLDSTLYGKLNLNANLVTDGTTEQDFTDNVTGTINALVEDGRVKSNNLTEALNKSLSKFMSFNDITFDKLSFKSTVKEGVITVDTLKMNSKVLADWFAFGTFETNGDLDMKIESRLSKKLSKPLVKLGGKAEKASSGLIDQYLGGTGLDAVAKSEIQKRGVSADNDGRVTVLIHYGGTLDKPDPAFTGFKQVEGASAPESKKSEPIISKEQVKQKVAQVQQDVKKEVQKVEQDVKQEVQKAEKEILQEVDKIGGEEAKKEVKKLFKGLGF